MDQDVLAAPAWPRSLPKTMQPTAAGGATMTTLIFSSGLTGELEFVGSSQTYQDVLVQL
jgi:hypothetical protein